MLKALRMFRFTDVDGVNALMLTAEKNPGILRENWSYINHWVNNQHEDAQPHTDVNHPPAPHYDTTRYYDFF